jgi:DNA-binding transcriptional regulator YiaG
VLAKNQKKLSKSAPRTSTLGTRPEYAELGDLIRGLRESKGLQQKPLSRAMGKPEQFLNKVEMGRQRIDVIEFLDLLHLIEPGGGDSQSMLLGRLNNIVQAIVSGDK